ncbi:MAG: ABC transporter permease [Bacteroidales bacterium]|nr:ABC transporter permease [Bacteroidales bacterium]
MFGHYFTVAVRNLLKYKTQNLICIVGLAAGILCFTFCLYCSRFVYDYNKCFENSERIVSLREESIAKGYSMGNRPVVAEELRMLDIPSMESVTYFSFASELPFNVNVQEDITAPYNLVSVEIDTAFNAVFGLDIIAGSWEGAAMQQNSIIISRSSAERIFGNAADAVGKTMILARRLLNRSTPPQGGAVYSIAAVMEDIPLNNSLSFMQHLDVLRLNCSEGALQNDKMDFGGAEIYALLKENVTSAEFEQQLMDAGYVYKFNSDDFKIVASYPQVWDSFALISKITLITGILIIVIALINFFNFQVSLFNARTREYSLRKVFGANRRQLFFQLYMQVVVVLLVTALLLLSLIEMFNQEIRLTLEIAEMEMQFSRALLMKHALQYIVLLLVSSTIICWFIVRKLYKKSVYRGVASKPVGGSVIGRNIMLWWQLFITWIFAGAVAALIMQFKTGTDTLFPTLSAQQKEEILSIPMDWFFMDNSAKEALIGKFGQHSGVLDVMCAGGALTEGPTGMIGLNWQGIGETDQFMSAIYFIPSSYFRFMNIPLMQGSMPVNENEVLVDGRFVKRTQTDVLGKNAYSRNGFFRNGFFNITGVVGEPMHSNYEGGVVSYGVMFVPQEIENIRHCYLKCQPQQVKEVRKWVMGILEKELPKDVEYEVGTFLNDIYEAQGLENFLRKVFVFFALVCIVLTLLGVYSSISFDTQRRQKEIALRKINGAGKHNIAWVFVRLYTILLCSSAAVAFPLLYMMFGFWKQIYVRFFEYGVSFWCGLFAFLTIMVAVTIAWKIRQIVNLNPAAVIKSE